MADSARPSFFLSQLGLPNTYTEKQAGWQVSGTGQFLSHSWSEP